MGDFISPLGWLGENENRLVVDRLLRRAEPDAPDKRTCLYICPECADFGCGAITAVIERVDECIVWRDFGFQNNYNQIQAADLEDVGPFEFNATEYYIAINMALD